MTTTSDVLQAVILRVGAPYIDVTTFYSSLIKKKNPDWYNVDDDSDWNATLDGAVELLGEKTSVKGFIEMEINSSSLLKQIEFKMMWGEGHHWAGFGGYIIDHTVCFCTESVREYSRILRLCIDKR